ncbi:MAG: hypothetical protein GY863_22445 [bacterium]|nr:hypothetical protein [bacterium]
MVKRKPKKSETDCSAREIQDIKHYSENQQCNCCMPTGRLYIGTKSVAKYVENSIEMKRRLQVRSDANASLKPPGGPDTNADGSGGSQIDEGLLKDQGKVYRTDEYEVNWTAEGFGPLRVMLELSGAIAYTADWLPSEGSVTLSKNQLLKPPDYIPGSTTVNGVITVQDCKGQKVLFHHTVTI